MLTVSRLRDCIKYRPDGWVSIRNSNDLPVVSYTLCHVGTDPYDLLVNYDLKQPMKNYLP